MELEGDAEERKARAIKLPKIIKNMPKAQLRELLRTAQVPDQQCTDRPQLMVRLKQIERQSRQGSGLSVAQLIAKAGLDGKGKRASPEGASSTATATSASQGRPKRLRRGNVQYAGLDSDAEDEEEVRLETTDHCKPVRHITEASRIPAGIHSAKPVAAADASAAQPLL